MQRVGCKTVNNVGQGVWRHECLAFVCACLAIRRTAFRKLVVDGGALHLACWIPRALQQIYIVGNQGQGK